MTESQYTFDELFWPNVVAQIVQNPTQQQIIIVPDASMYVPFQKAWVAHARTTKRAYVMPKMMTLLDWAKSYGAVDFDFLRIERVIMWMAQLQNTPHLLEWLAGADDADTFAIASSMVLLSDELSLHFLAGQNINKGEMALRDAIERVYDAQAHNFAHQELEVLLQCWRADVSQNTPVIRYLATLSQILQKQNLPKVSVIRNRHWSEHEQWFWSNYPDVHVFDVRYVRATRAVENIHAAWHASRERILAAETILKNEAVHVIAAAHIEDEAQAVTQQVIRWREQGLKKIALVALDRTVTRRVWSLLGRLGIRMRDDTGWLLSTSRTSCSWQQGFELWSGQLDTILLLDWLSHPMVFEAEPNKSDWLFELRQLAYSANMVLHTWQAWLKYARQKAASEAIIEFFIKAQRCSERFFVAKTMPQWVDCVLWWASEFGLLTAWKNDVAGQVWLALLESWRGIETQQTLSFNNFMRVVQSEVEQQTFRPHDVADEILLLPLGSTRMRDFEAAWLMGADVLNLPSAQMDQGLLNFATRQSLHLSTYLDQHELALRDLVDLFARTPQVVASYCKTKEGAPNALSNWLMQWLRAEKSSQIEFNTDTQTTEVQVADRSQAQIANCVPQKLSATQLSSLVACPYQFYAKHVLNLRLNQFAEDEINPADKGSLWHQIIVDFHERRERDVSPETDLSKMYDCIDSRLQKLCFFNPRYWVVRETFYSYAPAFVAWWRSREAQGWRVLSNETWHSVMYEQLHWQGKIDQIDVREYCDPIDGITKVEYALIDYKTGSVTSYQKAIAQNEEIQLAFYLNLFKENHCIQAGYIGVSDTPSKPRKTEKAHQGDDDYPQAWLNASQYTHDDDALLEAASQLRQRVNQNFDEMRLGAPLVAMGELKACQWCQVRGLCRKGYTHGGVL